MQGVVKRAVGQRNQSLEGLKTGGEHVSKPWLFSVRARQKKPQPKTGRTECVNRSSF